MGKQLVEYREAIRQALNEEMAKDKRIFVMGEEVAEYNGAYKVTKGMLDKWGPDRVIDTPIAELGFADYFLTIWEIVEFARSRDILCQGRGSAANSAVCYCLGITAIDPVRSGLLFERFLSRERAEPHGDLLFHCHWHHLHHSVVLSPGLDVCALHEIIGPFQIVSCVGFDESPDILERRTV